MVPLVDPSFEVLLNVSRPGKPGPFCLDSPRGRGGGRGSLPRRLYTGGMPTKEEVVEALRQVEDPELGMDIVELGLMYDVDVQGSNVHVTYTLTSMGCPVGPMIEEQIHQVAAEVPGVESVEAELTWTPPWSPEKMSDDAKFILGFG
jgi:metal-sulfur cluster biosynthetic enzyme